MSCYPFLPCACFFVARGGREGLWLGTDNTWTALSYTISVSTEIVAVLICNFSLSPTPPTTTHTHFFPLYFHMVHSADERTLTLQIELQIPTSRQSETMPQRYFQSIRPGKTSMFKTADSLQPTHPLPGTNCTFSWIISQSSSVMMRWMASNCRKMSRLCSRLLSISLRKLFTSKSHDFTIRSVMSSSWWQSEQWLDNFKLHVHNQLLEFFLWKKLSIHVGTICCNISIWKTRTVKW